MKKNKLTPRLPEIASREQAYRIGKIVSNTLRDLALQYSILGRQEKVVEGVVLPPQKELPTMIVSSRGAGKTAHMEELLAADMARNPDMTVIVVGLGGVQRSERPINGVIVTSKDEAYMVGYDEHHRHRSEEKTLCSGGQQGECYQCEATPEEAPDCPYKNALEKDK